MNLCLSDALRCRLLVCAGREKLNELVRRTGSVLLPAGLCGGAESEEDVSQTDNPSHLLQQTVEAVRSSFGGRLRALSEETALTGHSKII